MFCYQIFTVLLSNLYAIRSQLVSNKSVPFPLPFPTYHSKGTGLSLQHRVQEGGSRLERSCINVIASWACEMWDTPTSYR